MYIIGNLELSIAIKGYGGLGSITSWCWDKGWEQITSPKIKLYGFKLHIQNFKNLKSKVFHPLIKLYDISRIFRGTFTLQQTRYSSSYTVQDVGILSLLWFILLIPYWNCQNLINFCIFTNQASLWLFLIIFIGAVRLVIIDHLENKLTQKF